MSSKLTLRAPAAGTAPVSSPGLSRIARPTPAAALAAAALVAAVVAASVLAAAAVSALLTTLAGPVGVAAMTTLGLAAVAAVPVAVRRGLLAARDAIVR